MPLENHAVNTGRSWELHDWLVAFDASIQEAVVLSERSFIQTSVSEGSTIVGQKVSRSQRQMLARHKPLRKLPQSAFDPSHVNAMMSCLSISPGEDIAHSSHSCPLYTESGIHVMLQQLHHIPQSVPELRSAAQLAQHT